MKKRVLIVGAGVSGKIIGEKLLQNSQVDLLGYLDDDLNKQGKYLNGKEVFGGTELLRRILARRQIHEVIFSFLGVRGETLRRWVNDIGEQNVSIQVVPGYLDLLEEDKKIDYPIRELGVEDLLHRGNLDFDLAKIQKLISGRSILVTGAGGSIGSELSRLIATLKPKRIILLGRGENSIFQIHSYLKQLYSHLSLETCIANITDLERLREVFFRYQPEVVFHTAAHKHVPLMEQHPKEAFWNNVFGTKNVLQISEETGVQRLVFISTDKAVQSTNIMGLTKRLGELLTCTWARERNLGFSVVRFGNVLASRGSVIPLFREQILRGGPVTVTHRDMYRYFMTLQEASCLVLQSGAIAQSGEILVLNMGEAVSIYQLAKLMIRLYSSNPKDIAIRFTGLRQGEKLKEKLWNSDEVLRSSSNSQIYILESDSVPEKLLFEVQSLEKEMYFLSDREFRKRLADLVQSSQKKDQVLSVSNVE